MTELIVEWGMSREVRVGSEKETSVNSVQKLEHKQICIPREAIKAILTKA